MSKKAREQGVPVLTLWKLTLKNMFSIIYFVIVGLLLAVVYTRFLVKPSFTASGNIENIGGVSHTLMPRIVTIATEPETLDRVVDFLEIAEEEKPSKKSEIKSNLTIANYNSTTMKIKVSYRGGNSEQVLLIINSVIDVTIERFIEESPANEGKIIKQRTPITATAAGLSNKIIYVGFVVLGAIFGVVIGVGTDLLKRKLYFESDVQEYGLPYNFMNINRKKKDETPIIENKAFVDGIVVLQDRLEGASRRTRTNVIGVVNLGYETYNVLPGLLADNTSTVGLKSLIIDLDFEHPSIHSLYNIESNEGITDILQNKKVKPLQVKDNLFVITTKEYAYPARFLKDERLKDLIRTLAKEFDYIFINVPVNDYYASLLFNFELIDMLLINTSVDGTKMQKLDQYIENIEVSNRNKLFINTIDSKAKRELPQFLKPKKKPN
jgi:capsular polysaccharide biosynthesis protein